MSGVAVVRYLLANNASLISVVPASKIMAGTLPIRTALPAISIRQISGSELKHIRRSDNELVTDRVQVSALASTYSQQKSILNQIRTALPATRGTINGVVVDSVQQDITGPDLYNEDPIIYEQSIDYLIKYTR